ncbi:MAG: VWA domain-containing protein [Candidatus Binatia bacterium]
MFLDLFYGLRDEGVPVSMQEWQTFLRALEEGLHGSNLLRFYHLGKACLVKSETYFDAYDRVFARVFQGVEGAFGEEVTDRLLDWLRDPKNFPNLSPEELAALEQLSSDELMRRFLERLAEQTERHDGGGKWVGTGGKSPFGHGGQHPTGIRVGGSGRSRSAMKVAEERRFRDYRTDLTLDVRNLRVALRRLRQLTRTGLATELDLDETIDETCRNAGEIELVFRAPRRNDVRLLLLMDVGGTMDPYHEPVSQLLTALHEEHGLRDLEAYYFHNCVYDHVYRAARMLRADALPTADLLRRLDARWKVVVVGDAAMHPSELLERFGGIDPRVTTPTPGVVWLHRIATHFDRTAWLNPEPSDTWDDAHTTRVIRKLFPMFHLSVDGLTAAVQALVGARAAAHEHP